MEPSADEELGVGCGEATGHRTEVESEASELSKVSHDANDKPLDEQIEAPSRCSSGESVDVVDDGKVLIQQPKASSEPIREPVKSKVRLPGLTVSERLTDLSCRLSRRAESRIASLASRQVSIWTM